MAAVKAQISFTFKLCSSLRRNNTLHTLKCLFWFPFSVFKCIVHGLNVVYYAIKYSRASALMLISLMVWCRYSKAWLENLLYQHSRKICYVKDLV
jgi:hypothetical protein